MTKDEALKLALEALEEAKTNNDGIEKWDRNKKAITAIKEALAQLEQEPVAWMNPHGGMLTANYIDNFASGLDKEIHNIPLYTTPPQRTWVALTDDEIKEIHHLSFGKDIAIATGLTEAKLKEKNT